MIKPSTYAVVLGFALISAAIALYTFGYDRGVTKATQDNEALYQQAFINVKDSFKLEHTLINSTKNYGFYIDNVGFCVRTRNRTPEEIARTTFHEMAHYFAYQDPSHFNVAVEDDKKN